MNKLDMRGVTHDLILVGVVAIFAIVGVAFLVGSRAGTPPPTSGPVSGPVSYASCSLESVGPNSQNKAVHYLVTVYSKMDRTFTPNLKVVTTITNSQNQKTTTTKMVTMSSLKNGSSTTKTLGYARPTKTDVVITHEDPKFTCSGSFKPASSKS